MIQNAKSGIRNPKPGTALAIGLIALAGVVLANPAQADTAATTDLQALRGEAATVMQGFGGKLLGELRAAMERGGPVEAIQVCAAKAGPMAKEASAESGWTVGRTSHRLRSPDNAPDAFEQAVLEDFVARQAAGEPAAELVHAEVVDGPDGASTFRFVRAIPTAELCLACHGTDIAPDVATALDDLYPNDAARGFTPGQMRGVFTLSKPL